MATKRRWFFTINIDGEDENNAWWKLNRQVDNLARGGAEHKDKFQIEFQGFIHPDGEIRQCDVPPDGFRLIYQVDHHHYVMIAVPSNSNIELDLNTFSNLPKGSMHWDEVYHPNKWKPFD